MSTETNDLEQMKPRVVWADPFRRSPSNAARASRRCVEARPHVSQHVAGGGSVQAKIATLCICSATARPSAFHTRITWLDAGVEIGALAERVLGDWDDRCR